MLSSASMSMCIYREEAVWQDINEWVGDVIWMRSKSKRWNCLLFAAIDFHSKHLAQLLVFRSPFNCIFKDYYDEDYAIMK